MADLKPCPFCGADTACSERIGDSYELQCGSCQAYTWGETDEAAVAAWNRRSRMESTQQRPGGRRAAELTTGVGSRGARRRSGSPLTVTCDGNTIAITIGIETIAHAAPFSTEKLTEEGKFHRPVITDKKTLAAAVIEQLLAEREDGSTPVTRMLDECIVSAIESGCDGVAEDWEEVGKEIIQLVT
jgi:hypothetical protein